MTNFVRLVDWYYDRVKIPIMEWYNERLLRKEFPPGSYIEDCRYHPCVVLGIISGGIWCISLINSKQITCDPVLCGVKKLDVNQVNDIITKYKTEEEFNNSLENVNE